MFFLFFFLEEEGGEEEINILETSNASLELYSSCLSRKKKRSRSWKRA